MDVHTPQWTSFQKKKKRREKEENISPFSIKLVFGVDSVAIWQPWELNTTEIRLKPATLDDCTVSITGLL